MNQNKLITLLVGIIAICVVIIGVLVLRDGGSTNKSDGVNYDFKAGVFKGEDLTLIDTQTNKAIALGMKRKEIERIIGPEVDSAPFDMSLYVDNLKVKYRDNIAVAFSIHDESVRFETSRGISIGSNVDQVNEAYGESSTPKYPTYQIEKKGSKYIYHSNDVKDIDAKDRTNYYYISFTTDEDGINSILVGDSLFAVMMQ